MRHSVCITDNKNTIGNNSRARTNNVATESFMIQYVSGYVALAFMFCIMIFVSVLHSCVYP